MEPERNGVPKQLIIIEILVLIAFIAVVIYNILQAR